jgi:molybdopterin-guanine dinucleotide biosynthesis protein A
VVADLRPGEGPLAGLESALASLADGEALLLVGGDMPGLASPALGLLVDAFRARPGAEAAAFMGPRGAEPLPAIYARTLLARVHARLDAGERALHPLLDGAAVARVDAAALAALDPDGLTLANVNTPDDLARLDARLCGSPGFPRR